MNLEKVNKRDFDIVLEILTKKVPIKDRIEISFIDEEIKPGTLRVVYEVYIGNSWFYEETFDIELNEYRDKVLEKLINCKS